MVSVYDIDPKTISWIKEEVDKSIGEAQKALQLYVESPDNDQELSVCLNLMHRICGAVDVVEIFGATLLATEVENVVRGLIQNSIEMRSDAIEVLMRGILQLPAYLEHLHHGNKDIPLVLLPLLNDLLAVQDKDLLTESTFFFPNLSVYKSHTDEEEHKIQNLSNLAKKLRPGYLSGLLGVFRDIDVHRSLNRLATVTKKLEEASRNKKIEQVWWVVLGLIQALYDHGLESSVAVKLLLGRVDRQIKRIIDEGEDVLETDPPNELIKNLLYYIGRSNSVSPRVTDLKTAFSLGDSLPDHSAISQIKDELIGFNANIMDTISKQINEELFKIKDLLDLAIYSSGEQETELQAVIDRMSTVADALGMLGLVKIRRIINDQKLYLKHIIKTDKKINNDDILRVAGVVLYIESSLCDLNINSDSELSITDFSGTEGSVLPEAEFRQVRNLVVQDALTEIEKLKVKIENCFLNETEKEEDKEIDKEIDLIAGALKMLNFDRVSTLIKSAGPIFKKEIEQSLDQLDEKRFDLIADVIVAIEYFLEGVIGRAVEPEHVLEIAETSLARLGLSRQLAQKEQSDSGDVPVFESQKGNFVHANESDFKVVQSSDVDKELVEVFLSEADDELESMHKYLEELNSDPKELTSINHLVRSFHTLKGAGRIIGAAPIGMLAWSIEQLLRSVQDGHMVVTSKVIELLEKTIPTLRLLIEQVKLGDLGSSSPEVQNLVEQVHNLRQKHESTV